MHDFALSLKPGALTVITGPSGCGKTTLLRMIAGLDKDFTGSIALPAHARLAMVFQEPSLLPWRNVEQNVRIAAPAASADTIDQLFAMLDLNVHRTHYPGELSLGLARRVALARAFAIEPDILLLDEPFVSLDAALAQRLRDEFMALLDKRPVTSLLVTHDLAEAAKLADDICVLSGRPARLISELELELPRAVRTKEDIDGTRVRLAELLAGGEPGIFNPVVHARAQ